jgi:sulfoxide reductase heme-binding subunit YedZ
VRAHLSRELLGGGHQATPQPRLGGKNWNRLHWLTYTAAISGVVHYWWGVKTGVKTPMTITVILGILLLARPILRWRQDRAALRVQRSEAA